LRLAIGPGGLGLELARPATLACVTVAELSIAIPGIRFPLDVSGGVSRFRSRRGRLERLVLELRSGSLVRWLAPRVRGVIGVGIPEVWVSVRRGGATLGLFERSEPGASSQGDVRAAPRILAFEVALDPEGDDLRLRVHGARGSGLPSPAVPLALRVMHEAVGAWATREGSSFFLRALPRTIARTLLPDAGVRAPDTTGVRFVGIAAQDDLWLLFADATGAPAEVDLETLHAREAVELTRESDDALLAGDVDGARTRAVVALEKAPRHREVSRRIADIDRVAHGRAEAALGVMVEADVREADRDGLLVAELLEEIGDRKAALACFARIGEREPVVPLAARAFERAADLTEDPYDALVWLDMAIARAPGIARLRWSRLTRRLAAGRVEEALADAEHLEAQTSGTGARHAVWTRAGRAWADAGRTAEAAELFERALRFNPSDPEACAGLGRAFIASHREIRGISLLSRAVELAARRGDPAPRLALELAEALAVVMDDRPAAVARLRTIAGTAGEVLRARGLEGRWRNELGDVAGASVVFARMRELAGTMASDTSGELAVEAAAFLMEAAEFEGRVRKDHLAAQRHLACALRLTPHDPSARAAYREVGLRIAGVSPPRPSPEENPPREDVSRPASTESPRIADEAEDAARAEELIRKLHADPDDDRVVDDLGETLLRLGRSHELLALLSARIEDAPPDRRAMLVPKQRQALERLVGEARDAGRTEEAALFELALSALT